MRYTLASLEGIGLRASAERSEIPMGELVSSFPPSSWSVLCLHAPKPTQSARAGCDDTPPERVQESKNCTGVQYFEFKMYLQCSGSAQSKNSRQLFSGMHATSTMLYRCMRGCIVLGTVRRDIVLRCSVIKFTVLHKRVLYTQSARVYCCYDFDELFEVSMD